MLVGYCSEETLRREKNHIDEFLFEHSYPFLPRSFFHSLRSSHNSATYFCLSPNYYVLSYTPLRCVLTHSTQTTTFPYSKAVTPTTQKRQRRQSPKSLTRLTSTIQEQVRWVLRRLLFPAFCPQKPHHDIVDTVEPSSKLGIRIMESQCIWCGSFYKCLNLKLNRRRSCWNGSISEMFR